MLNQTRPASCRNCGATLEGPYCHQCGQSANVIRRHSRDLLEDALGNVFQWDSRLIQTLRLLFCKPGRLALDWIEGKRSRYVPPFRLYIVASFILFLLIGIMARDGSQQIESVEISSSAIESVEKELEEARANGEWLNSLLLQGVVEAMQDPKGFIDKLLANLPKAAFLLLPVFALLHMAVNFRRERYYIDHLVFSLHFHAFAFLVFSMIFLAGLVSQFLGSIFDLLNLAIPIYLVPAFHTFNQQGWIKSALKAFLVFGAYSVILVIAVTLYMSLMIVI